MDLSTLRWVLLVSLSITLLFVWYRRFRVNTLSKEVPVVKHAELTQLDVAYHPERLRLSMTVPRAQEMHAAVLDDGWNEVKRFPARLLEQGRPEWVLEIGGLLPGRYYVRLTSSGQSTERMFILHGA